MSSMVKPFKDGTRLDTTLTIMNLIYFTTAFLGSSPFQPAVSCQEIKDASWGQAPGRYWLFSGGHENKPAVAYCDMEKGGKY